jgi:uncharacterized integral membrane protein
MKHEAVDYDETAASGTSGPPIKLLLLLLLTIGLAVFFFQNAERAPIEFLWLDGDWPIWTVIGISVIVGVVLDRLVTWQWRRARRRKQAPAG